MVLLDYLLEKDNWCSMEELKQLLQVTDKTVLHYIEALTTLLAEYGEKYLS